MGSGASAQVFSAWDVALRRQVAVKVLHPALAADGSFLRRFRAEAQAAAALHHPHVLAVFDWGEDGGEPFLVLEHLGGGSLRDVLDAGTLLDVPQAAKMGIEACEALAYAHSRGFVHRDVKPANLLFDEEGRLRVADFGLARALAEAAWTEPAGAFIGTARYASPEQVEGRSLDAKADVYSLALVLYEALTGSVPFSADTAIATLMARVGAFIEESPELGALWPVLVRAADPDASLRPSAATMGNALKEIAAQLSPPEPIPTLGRGAGSRRAAGDGNETSLGGPPGTGVGPGTGPEPGGNTGLGESARPGGGVGMGGSAGPYGGTGPGGGAHRASEANARQAVPDARQAVAGHAGARVGHGAARRRRRWPWVLAVALVAAGLLGAGGTYAAIRLQVFVPSRQVPRLTGLSAVSAARRLRAEHLVLDVAARRYDVSVKAGDVASQRPGPRSTLKQGSVVHVVVSLGPPPVKVPSLTGLSGCAAMRAALARAHLVASCTKAHSTSVPEGGIISVSPDRSALWGSTVAVVVSSGLPSVSVPDLSGTDCAAAKALLASAHLAGSCTKEYSTSVQDGQVISWSPSTTATWGSTVQVVVSLGPPMAQVPSLAYDSVPEAVAALQGVHLVAGNVYGPAGGRVFYSTPQSGQWVQEGTAVNLYTQ